jgi:hypothetical protein
VAFPLSTFQAEGRPVPPWLLVSNGQLKVIKNLLLWRLFCSAMIDSRYGDPSGSVPGVAMVVHGWNLERDGDGVGPDRVFIFRSGVFSAKLQDLVVIFDLCRVFLMYCNSTAFNE